MSLYLRRAPLEIKPAPLLAFIAPRGLMLADPYNLTLLDQVTSYREGLLTLLTDLCQGQGRYLFEPLEIGLKTGLGGTTQGIIDLEEP